MSIESIAKDARGHATEGSDKHMIWTGVLAHSYCLGRPWEDGEFQTWLRAKAGSRFEEIYLKTEEAILEHDEASCSVLDMQHRRKEPHYHPLKIFYDIRKHRCFDHFTSEQIFEAMRHWKSRPSCCNGAIGHWPRMEFFAAAEPHVVINHLIRQHGMICESCRAAKNDTEFRVYQSEEPKGFICDECLTSVRRTKANRFMVDAAFARQHQKAVAKRNVEREAEREARVKRAETRRVLERAAYEVLEEMGMIPEIEARIRQHAEV